MKMKFKTFYDIKDSDIVANRSGNGLAKLQYHLNDKLHRIVPTLDEKTGEQITHNLYEDIQNNKSFTNYKKLLEINGLPPLENDYTGEIVDYSNIGSFSDIIKANNKIYKETGKTLNDLVVDYIAKNQSKSSNNSQVDNSQVANEDNSK